MGSKLKFARLKAAATKAKTKVRDQTQKPKSKSKAKLVYGGGQILVRRAKLRALHSEGAKA
jgi:hypothetical protein